MTTLKSDFRSTLEATPTTIKGRFSKTDLRGIYDDFAPAYKWEELTSNYLFGLWRVRRRHLSRAQGQVLDVAAGTGSNFPFLRQADHITAVDLSPAMLALAQARAARLKRPATCQVMDAEALEFDNDQFDTVVTTLSTCTFPDPVRALREMARVCKPAGRILLLEHGRSSWGLVARYQDRTAHKHYAQAGCRWNQAPLALVREAGLIIIEARRSFAGVFQAIEARKEA